MVIIILEHQIKIPPHRCIFPNVRSSVSIKMSLHVSRQIRPIILGSSKIPQVGSQHQHTGHNLGTICYTLSPFLGLPSGIEYFEYYSNLYALNYSLLFHMSENNLLFIRIVIFDTNTNTEVIRNNSCQLMTTKYTQQLI